MTINNELTKHSGYFKMSFVEMLEFIGRGADIWAESQLDDDVSTVSKIEAFLDELFEHFDKKRNLVHIECESESCSDEDY
jgi:hypothetical protein